MSKWSGDREKEAMVRAESLSEMPNSENLGVNGAGAGGFSCHALCGDHPCSKAANCPGTGGERQAEHFGRTAPRLLKLSIIRVEILIYRHCMTS